MQWFVHLGDHGVCECTVVNTTPGQPGPAGDRGDPGMTGEFGRQGDSGEPGPHGDDGFPVRILEPSLFIIVFILKSFSDSSHCSVSSCRDLLESAVCRVQKDEKERRVWPRRKVQCACSFISFQISIICCVCAYCTDHMSMHVCVVATGYPGDSGDSGRDGEPGSPGAPGRNGVHGFPGSRGLPVSPVSYRTHWSADCRVSPKVTFPLMTNEVYATV